MHRSLSETMRNTTIFTRLTVSLSRAAADRLALLRDAHGVSVSALVEHAVANYFEQTPAATVAEHLRANGISLRRSRG